MPTVEDVRVQSPSFKNGFSARSMQSKKIREHTRVLQRQVLAARPKVFIEFDELNDDIGIREMYKRNDLDLSIDTFLVNSSGTHNFGVFADDEYKTSTDNSIDDKECVHATVHDNVHDNDTAVFVIDTNQVNMKIVDTTDSHDEDDLNIQVDMVDHDHHFIQESLPDSTTDQFGISADSISSHDKELYFSMDKSKDHFYDTYRTLSKTLNICEGRHAQLRELITEPDECENILKVAAMLLIDTGILTPRDHTESIESDMKHSEQVNVAISTCNDSATADDANCDVNTATSGIMKTDLISKAHIHEAADNDDSSRIGKEVDSSLHLDLTRIDVSSNDDISDSNNESIGGDFVGNCNTAVIEEPGQGLLDDIGTFFDDNGFHSLSHYRQQSPRATFLMGCLKHNMPPRTVALLRKRLTSKLDLSHMGLKDTYGKLLSECVHSMPIITSLILSDNMFTDDGLTDIFNSLQHMPHLEELDISSNKIGKKSSAALGTYFNMYDKCKLKKLFMCSSNICDLECNNFTTALHRNSSLEVLDLSSNQLGADEVSHSVRQDFQTAGESIAKLLQSKNCKLKTLILKWNMLKMVGAQALCASISHAHSLVHLDLSYNSVGSNGCLALGNALLNDSKALQVLNLSNNSITSNDTFCIITGVKNCKYLHTIVLDENPVGENGGRLLAEMTIYYGNVMCISCLNCNPSVSYGAFPLNLTNTLGSYTLDMSDFMQRCIAFQLLDLVSYDVNVHFSSFVYTNDSNIQQVLDTKLTRYKEVRNMIKMTDSIKQEMHELNLWIHLMGDSSLAMIRTLFKKYDTDSSGYLDAREMRKLLKNAGINYSTEQVRKIIFAFDTDGNSDGVIEWTELVSYIRQQGTSAQSKLDAILLMPRMGMRVHAGSAGAGACVAEGDMERYIPPNKGKITCTIARAYEYDSTYTSMSMSQSLIDNAFQQFNKSSSPETMIRFSLEIPGIRLQCSEALSYASHLFKSANVIDSSVTIFNALHSSKDATMLAKALYGHNLYKKRSLMSMLGNRYKAIMGIPSGFYTLDLAKEGDLLAFERLVVISNETMSVRRAQGKGDMSQHGVWNCFRNEVVHDDDTSSVIQAALTNQTLRKVKIDFDFIDVSRPDHCCDAPIRDTRLLSILETCGFKLGNSDGLCGLDWYYETSSSIKRGIRGSYAHYQSHNPPFNRANTLKSGYKGAAFHHLNKHKRRAACERALLREEYQYYMNTLNNPDEPTDEPGEHEQEQADNPLHEDLQMLHNIHSLDDINIIENIISIDDNASTHTDGMSVSDPHPNSDKYSKMDIESLKSNPLVSKYFSDPVALLFENINISAAAVTFFESTAATAADGSHSPASPTASDTHSLVVNVPEMGRGLKRKMHLLMHDPKAGKEYKCALINDTFEMLCLNKFFLSRQVAIIMKAYPYGAAWRWRAAGASYRVNLLLVMLPRVLDIENIGIVYDSLTQAEAAELFSRVGYLYLLNPIKCNGYYELVLTNRDDFLLTKFLMHIGVKEPGKHWMDSYHHKSVTMQEHSFWELTKIWYTDETFFNQGLLSLTYVCNSHVVDITTRFNFYPFCLVDQLQVLNGIYDLKGTDDDSTRETAYIQQFSVTTVADAEEALKMIEDITWKYT